MVSTEYEIRYEVSKATTGQILAHLLACSDQFHPPLAARVDLPAYSEKLHRHSVRSEAWAGGELVGLVATYMNSDANPPTAFVSNVSVLANFRGCGIGESLLRQGHRQAISRQMQRSELEVSATSLAAVALYGKLGYVQKRYRGESMVMQLELEAQ